MVFSDFSFLCSSLEKASSRLVKKSILKKFFLFYSPSIIASCIHFLTFRFSVDGIHILLFQLDEVQIVKIIAEYLGQDVLQLQKILKYEVAGDIGAYYLRYGKDNSSDISFLEIFSLITEIGSIQGEGSQDIKKKKVSHLLAKVSREDACYILRLFVGTFRIGVSDKTILEVLLDIFIEKNKNSILSKSDLEYLYGVFPDLGILANMILSGETEQLLSLMPRIGLPIQSQAAEVFFKANPLLINFEKAEYLIQPKYDGFRLQAHILPNFDVILFSRNQLVVTDLFFEIKIIIEMYARKNNFYGILDGEIVGFDAVNNIYLSFQETAKQKRKNKGSSSEERNLRYIIFDILVNQEKNLMKSPYFQRLEILDAMYLVLGIEVVKSFRIENYHDIDVWQEQFIVEGYEGAMIKNIASIYEPGKRTRTWLKYKKIQKDSLEDTIDVVILGYNLSKGAKNQRQMIGSLLVGIYDEERDSYFSVAQVGSGGDANLWNDIYQKLIGLKVEAKLPYVFINQLRFPDYFVIPKIIVSLKADLVSASKEHTAGVSLRFPRLITVRVDKNEKETTQLKNFITST